MNFNLTYDEITTGFIASDEEIASDSANQKLRAQQRHSDVLQYLRQMLTSFSDIVFQPSHNGIEDLLLISHIQFVAADYVDELANG